MHIKEAQKSLLNLIDDVEGKNVLDIGCGSGIHALAFLRLGAKSVTCIDYDLESVKTTKNLLEKFYRRNTNYVVEKADILSSDFSKKIKLKKFDIVYSWGVLHHTGSMFKAIDNACQLVNKNGKLAIALYIKTNLCKFWVLEKKIYSSFFWIRPLIKFPFFLIVLFGYSIKKKITFRKVLNDYKLKRGMSLF